LNSLGKKSFLALCAATLNAVSALAMGVSLTHSMEAPAYVGQMVTWKASVDDAGLSSIRYQFVVSLEPGGPLEVIRDFSAEPDLFFTASSHEGTYLIEVTALDLATGETSYASESYRFVPRIQGRRPMVNPTDRPRVFLFSAPSCEAGSRMRVVFAPSSGGYSQATSFKDCNGGTTMNFYLAGLQPETLYSAYAVVDNGSAPVSGTRVAFQSGEAFDPLPNTLVKPAAAGAAQPLILTSNGYVTDLEGTQLWAGVAPVTLITRPESGGFFWGLVEDSAYGIGHQAIRKFDLTGMILRETNAEYVNRQLVARGRRPISSFHHEVRPMPDGRIIALAAVERILTDVQGEGDVNVIGDMILILDSNLNVLWTWDTFDWLDVRREALLGETCEVGTGGCPPFYLTALANDWTHGNSVQFTPDGNLLFSARHQDWLIKIDYADGQGDGHVIWKLGRDGDFTYLTSDPWPWFSHQHDGNFMLDDPSELLVFDNGNTRFYGTGEARSRGQAIILDEDNRTARFKLNADLGVLAAAVGSAQKLSSGNYHFDAGYVIEPDNSLGAYALETNPAGGIIYELKTRGLIYRSFRMTDLYTAPD
jgi:hypothetical protein